MHVRTKVLQRAGQSNESSPRHTISHTICQDTRLMHAEVGSKLRHSHQKGESSGNTLMHAEVVLKAFTSEGREQRK